MELRDDMFHIGAEDIDTAAVVDDIRKTVERKMAEGAYADARVTVAERTNLAGWQGQEGFSDYYLRCLREAAFVDITDFEIHERRSGFAPVLVRIKRFIWGLLRFYTYRLWSQQNEVNGLLVTGIEGVDEKYEDRIRTLEERLARLERSANAGAAAPPPVVDREA